MRNVAQRNALFALVLLSVIWSYNWIVMKQVLRSGPFDFAAWRYVLGTVVLFVALWLRGVSLRPPPLLPVVLVVLGLAQTMEFQALVQLALVEGGAGKTALLAYTMPFWAVPAAWWLLHERPSRRQLASIGVACWALGMVLSKWLFARGDVGLLSLTAWQMLAGSIGLVVIAVCVDERPIEWSGGFIAALAYNAVLASGLAWLLWSYIVERLPTSLAGLSSMVVPLLGILFAWALLGEVPSAAEAVGIALIGVALLVVGMRGKRDAMPEQPGAL